MDASSSRSEPSGGRGLAPWLAVAAFALTLVMNALAVLLPLAGRSTGEISDLYPVLITPAGFTFGIWSVIYSLLAVFVVVQATPAGRRDERLEGVRAPFIASCIFNASWLVAWHYLYVGASQVLMLGLLASLLLAYRRIGTGDRERADRRTVLLRIPFGIYLGWITVATVVNTRVTLFEAGWTGGGRPEVVATAAAVLALAVLTLVLLARTRDLAFAAVVVWALHGIRAANPDVPTLAWATVAAAALVLVGATLSLVRSPNRSRPT